MPLDHSQNFLRAVRTYPDTWDEEARTVEAVILTEAPVRRFDRQGEFIEILDPLAFDPSKFAGLPVLDSHRTDTVKSIVGTVLSARVEGNAIVGMLQITSADDAEPIRQRIADGSIRGTSIGYTVEEYKLGPKSNGLRTKIATSATLIEITLTATPADPNAGLRAQNGGLKMPETGLASEAETTTLTRSETRTLCRQAGLSAEQADKIIDEHNGNVDATKSAVLDATLELSRQKPRIRVHSGGADDPKIIQQRQSDALAYRMIGGELPDASRDFVETSIMDMARASLTRSGVTIAGLSTDEILQRAAHTTADFPLTVSNAVNKVALETYQAAQSPLKTLSRQRTLPNFKESTSIRLGEAGKLEPLAESGEITHTTRAESGEAFKLSTFARALNVSRELIINDDLGLLGDMTAALGEAAAQTEADLMVQLITENPEMSDGSAVFDVARGNTEALDLNDTQGIEKGRLALRRRTGLGGQPIAVAPKYLLVAPEQETQAERLLASIQPNKTEDVNPLQGKLELLVEPRLPEDGVFYIFGDPARLACLQHGYLGSAQGVQIQRQEAWTTLGLGFRAFLDFGAGWLDWRGVHRGE
ncbi:MAG: prohead protease/major capsid protein fusion protein [Pseudomonadota bacterium]